MFELNFTIAIAALVWGARWLWKRRGKGNE